MNNFCVNFLENLVLDIDENQFVATSCWFVETHAEFGRGSRDGGEGGAERERERGGGGTIQGRQLYRHDFMKSALNIVRCQNTCALIRFKHGIMLNTTILHSLIPV